METKVIFQFEIIIAACLSWAFLIHFNSYVMALRPSQLFWIFQRGDRHETSESDVYGRHIPTPKDCPRAGRVNYICTSWRLFKAENYKAIAKHIQWHVNMYSINIAILIELLVVFPVLLFCNSSKLQCNFPYQITKTYSLYLYSLKLHLPNINILISDHLSEYLINNHFNCIWFNLKPVEYNWL